MLSIVIRAVWLCLIAYAAWTGAWGSVAFHLVLFLGSGILLWLGTKDREYLTLDALVSLTFASTIVVSVFLSWDTGRLLSFDKLYHLLGGMCLGWFASIWYRGKASGTRYLAAIVLAGFVLGVAWELLEVLFALLPPPLHLPFNPLGWLDSLGDLVADTLGAGIVALLRRKG